MNIKTEYDINSGRIINSDEKNDFIKNKMVEQSIIQDLSKNIADGISGKTSKVAMMAASLVLLSIIISAKTISNILNNIADKTERALLNEEAGTNLFKKNSITGYNEVGCIDIKKSAITVDEVRQIAKKYNIPIACQKDNFVYVHLDNQKILSQHLINAYRNNEIGLDATIEYKNAKNQVEKISKRNVYEELKKLSQENPDAVKEYSLGYILPQKNRTGMLNQRKAEDEIAILKRANIPFSYVPGSNEKMIYANPQQIRFLQKEYEKSFYQCFSLQDKGFFERDNILKELYKANPRALVVEYKDEPDKLYLSPSDVSLLKERFQQWEQNKFIQHPYKFHPADIETVKKYCVDNNISFQRDGCQFSFKSKDFDKINYFIGQMLAHSQEEEIERAFDGRENESDSDKDSSKENEDTDDEFNQENEEFIEIFDDELDEEPKKEKKEKSNNTDTKSDNTSSYQQNNYDDVYKQNKDNLSFYDYYRNPDNDYSKSNPQDFAYQDISKEDVTQHIQDNAMSSYIEQAINITNMSEDEYNKYYYQDSHHEENSSYDNDNNDRNKNDSQNTNDNSDNVNNNRNEDNHYNDNINNDTKSSDIYNNQNENSQSRESQPEGIYVSKEDFNKAIESQVLKFNDGSSYYISNGAVYDSKTNEKQHLSPNEKSPHSYSKFIESHQGISTDSYHSVVQSMASKAPSYDAQHSYNAYSQKQYTSQTHTANPYQDYSSKAYGKKEESYQDVLKKVQENNERMDSANKRNSSERSYSGYHGSFVNSQIETKTSNPFSSVVSSMDYSVSKTKSNYSMRYAQNYGIGNRGTALSGDLFNKAALLESRNIVSNNISSLASPTKASTLYMNSEANLIKRTGRNFLNQQMGRIPGACTTFSVVSLQRKLISQSINALDNKSLSKELRGLASSIDISPKARFSYMGKTYSFNDLGNDINGKNIGGYIGLTRSLMKKEADLKNIIANSNDKDKVKKAKETLEAFQKQLNGTDLKAVEAKLLNLAKKGNLKNASSDDLVNFYFRNKFDNNKFDIRKLSAKDKKLLSNAGFSELGTFLLRATAGSATGAFFSDTIGNTKKFINIYKNVKSVLKKYRKLDPLSNKNVLNFGKNVLEAGKGAAKVASMPFTKNGRKVIVDKSAKSIKTLNKGIKQVPKSLNKAANSIKNIRKLKLKRISVRDALRGTKNIAKNVGLAIYHGPRNLFRIIRNHFNPILALKTKMKATITMIKAMLPFMGGFLLFDIIFGAVMFIIMFMMYFSVASEPNYVKANFLRLSRLETYLYDPALLGVTTGGKNDNLDKLFEKDNFLESATSTDFSKYWGDYPIVFGLETSENYLTLVRGYLRVKGDTKASWSDLEDEKYDDYCKALDDLSLAGEDGTGKYINGFRNYNANGTFSTDNFKIRTWYNEPIIEGDDYLNQGIYDGIMMVPVKPEFMLYKTGMSSNILSIISMTAYVFQQDFQSEGIAHSSILETLAQDSSLTPEGYQWIEISVSNSVPNYLSVTKSEDSDTDNSSGELDEDLSDDDLEDIDEVKNDMDNSSNSSGTQTIRVLVKEGDEGINKALIQNLYEEENGNIDSLNARLKKSYQVLTLEEIQELYYENSDDEYILTQLSDRQENITNYMIDMYGASHQINVSFNPDSYSEIEACDDVLQNKVDTKDDAVELFKLHKAVYDGEGNAKSLDVDRNNLSCQNEMSCKLNHTGLISVQGIEEEWYQSKQYTQGNIVPDKNNNINDLEAIQSMIEYCEYEHMRPALYPYTATITYYTTEEQLKPDGKSYVPKRTYEQEHTTSITINAYAEGVTADTNKNYSSSNDITAMSEADLIAAGYIPSNGHNASVSSPVKTSDTPSVPASYMCEDEMEGGGENPYLHEYHHCGGHFYLQLEIATSDFSTAKSHDLFAVDDNSDSAHNNISGGDYSYAELYGEDWVKMSYGGRWRNKVEEEDENGVVYVTKESDLLSMAQVLNQIDPAEQLGLTDSEELGSLYVSRAIDYDYMIYGPGGDEDISANGERYKKFVPERVDTTVSALGYEFSSSHTINHIKGASRLNSNLEFSIREQISEQLDGSDSRYQFLCLGLRSVGNIGYYYGGSSGIVKYGCFPQGLDCSGYVSWLFKQWYYESYKYLVENNADWTAKHPSFPLRGFNSRMSRFSTTGFASDTSGLFVPVNGELKPGDLLLKTTGVASGSTSSNHTAIYLGYMTLDVTGYRNYDGEKTGYWILQEGGSAENTNIACYDTYEELMNKFNQRVTFAYWDALDNM